jgi:type IV secretory pathway TrbD component
VIDTLSTTVSPWIFVLVIAMFGVLIAWIIRAQNRHEARMRRDVEARWVYMVHRKYQARTAHTDLGIYERRK